MVPLYTVLLSQIYKVRYGNRIEVPIWRLIENNSSFDKDREFSVRVQSFAFVTSTCDRQESDVVFVGLKTTWSKSELHVVNNNNNIYVTRNRSV